jgi:hypothetical protein
MEIFNTVHVLPNEPQRVEGLPRLYRLMYDAVPK